MILVALALAVAPPAAPGRAEPVEARAADTALAARPSTGSGRTEDEVDRVARQYDLAGEVLVARGEKILLDRGYGAVSPGGAVRHKPGARWRLASITKQVTATLLLRDHPNALDRPVGPAPAPTLRQLLTHHTGLPNPDATAAEAGGFPAFYRAPASDIGYCRSKPAAPGADFSYNNCDYLIAAADMGGVARWPAGMAMARGADSGIPGYVGGKREPAFTLATFGAAGGLIGTARDVYRFDRQLMTGTLLSAASRAELWKPEGGRSYQALGQWVFPGTLAGCAGPKRIVQRDGEIGGVQTRNFILPDDDLVVIVFTNRSADDFAIGEVWQGKGFAHDLLSAAACG